MVFNSYFFWLTSVPLLAVYFWLRPRHFETAKLVVLLYSYLFYSMWNPWFLLLLLAQTGIDYRCALWMEQYPQRKRVFVTASVVSNIGMLGFFKYSNFAMDSMAWLLSMVGLVWSPAHMHVVLPVGLSFYTFEALSYTIDVYRGVLTARRSFLDLALFVAYFPHLVAGPIVRARSLLVQFESVPPLSWAGAVEGVFKIVCGLFLKVVLADNAAPRVNALFAAWHSLGAAEAWAAATLFGVQVYGDFAGYSLVAIGLAGLMGFQIPANFCHPYGAVGFSDFWRRWHISLSTWLRDYLYIPLGGNRYGTVRTYGNLMLTMLLGGLWHGASIMFVVWGAMHGAYLCAERWGRARLGPMAGRSAWLLGLLLTYVTVSATWIPFRAQSGSQCFAMMGDLLGAWHPYPHCTTDAALVLGVLAFDCLAAHTRLTESLRRPVPQYGLLLAMLVGLFFFAGERVQFIYFQF